MEGLVSDHSVGGSVDSAICELYYIMYDLAHVGDEAIIGKRTRKK